MLRDENEKKELKEIEASFSKITEHRKAIEEEVYSLCRVIFAAEIPTRGFVISDKYDVFIDFKKVALDFMKYYNDVKKESMNNSIDVLKAMNELS